MKDHFHHHLKYYYHQHLYPTYYYQYQNAGQGFHPHQYRSTKYYPQGNHQKYLDRYHHLCQLIRQIDSYLSLR